MEQSPSLEANSHSASQLVKKFPSFHAIRRFIIVFTRARH